jgi:hypothetical protein
MSVLPVLDARWTYRVHEQILPALRQAKVPVRWTNLTARHTGYADPALRARKLERDIRLLTLDLEDRPDDPFVQRVRPIFKLFQGGQSLGDVSRHVRTRISDARFSSSCSGPGFAVSDDAILGANLADVAGPDRAGFAPRAHRNHLERFGTTSGRGPCRTSPNSSPGRRS